MRVPSSHEHVCHTVGDQQSLRLAAKAFLDNLEGRDGIFVHRYMEEEAWSILEAAGPARQLAAEGRLTVVGRVPGFQGTMPYIDHQHVATIVEKSADEASRRGRGLAILADASHAYINEGRAQEWFAFETWLGHRLKRDVVLVCLYWESDAAKAEIQGPMRATHVATSRWGVPVLAL